MEDCKVLCGSSWAISTMHYASRVNGLLRTRILARALPFGQTKIPGRNFGNCWKRVGVLLYFLLVVFSKDVFRLLLDLLQRLETRNWSMHYRGVIRLSCWFTFGVVYRRRVERRVEYAMSFRPEVFWWTDWLFWFIGLLYSRKLAFT